MSLSQEHEDLREGAEREVRRGNFRAAIATYEGLAAAYPAHAPTRARLAALQALLQPMELASPKATAAIRSAHSDVERGEEAANRGDHFGAVAAYRRAVAGSPGNALLEERLFELVEMLRAQSPARTPAPEPRDPIALLGLLLERVRARRRR